MLFSGYRIENVLFGLKNINTQIKIKRNVLPILSPQERK